MTFIIGSTNASSLSRKVSSLTGLPLAKTEVKNFPDGELYVRIDEKLEGEDIVLIFSGYPNQNSSLMELFLTLDAVKDLDPKKVSLIFTYMPYSKQDKRFKIGESVSVGTVLKLIKSFKINKISAINLHFAKEETDFDFFNIDIRNLNVAPLIADYVKKNYGDFSTILPGKGSSYLLTGNDVINLETRRSEYRTTSKEYFGEPNIISSKLDVKGRTVLVLDDILNTGGTMAKTCELVKKGGAKKVIAACVHGLFVGDAIEKLKKAGVDEIISTDTIESSFSRVSVAPMIAEEIKRI